MAATILALSCLLQFVAAILAIRLSRATGNRLPWTLIAVAVFLMGVRRSITLLRLVNGDLTRPPDVAAELVALLISTLMVVGIFRIRPWFESMSEAERVIGFMHAFDQAPVAVLLIQADRRIAYANQRAAKLNGTTPAELIDSTAERLIPEEERTPEGWLWGRSADDISANGRVVDGDRHIIGADDERLPVAVGISQVQLPTDTLIAVALDDLTQRRQLEDALQATSAELESFCYSISHDLRAPLRHIDGFTGAVLEDYGDQLDEGGRDLLGYVGDATARMGALIDDLLSLSRVTRREMIPTTVDLSAVAIAISAELRQIDPGRDVEFQIEGGIERIADPGLLRVALYNLLHNAWKFSEPADRARIQVGEQPRDGEQPAIFVRDNGTGFNPAYVDTIFAPFKRLHRQTSFPGKGIGLAVVQRIVARHGGTIEAESNGECGATFTFTLGETERDWQRQIRVTPDPPSSNSESPRESGES